MTEPIFETTNYESRDRQVTWQGISMVEGDGFDSFMTNNVASRLHDEEGSNEFEAHLRGLVNTGFASNSLNELLEADIPEVRNWAVGEAMAEAYLTRKHDVIWPWNMERDKRISTASLPGADLVGFETKAGGARFAFGEVKTSSDTNAPPNVMYGRAGMTHQIDNLARNLGLICRLLKWLLFRCKGTEHETLFNVAASVYLRSGNRALVLVGVLIRDTEPNELDLISRAKSLANTLYEPSTCLLVALYLPCTVSDLPTRISGGAS